MRVDSHVDKTLTTQDPISVSQSVELQGARHKPLLDNIPSIGEKRLNELIEHGNKVLQRLDTRLQWLVHQESSQMIVRVMNTETNEVLREIPPEKYLDLVQNLCEQVGLFLDEKK